MSRQEDAIRLRRSAAPRGRAARHNGHGGAESPFHVSCPLMEPPHVEKAALLAEWQARGIRPPSLYADGFAHANCGGGCVRSGQAQFERLLTKRPEVYAEWEAEEDRSRAEIGKDVAILRDRRGGTVKPLTLRSFRERLEAVPTLFDASDWGACNCMDGAA